MKIFLSANLWRLIPLSYLCAKYEPSYKERPYLAWLCPKVTKPPSNSLIHMLYFIYLSSMGYWPGAVAEPVQSQTWERNESSYITQQEKQIYFWNVKLLFSQTSAVTELFNTGVLTFVTLRLLMIVKKFQGPPDRKSVV